MDNTFPWAPNLKLQNTILYVLIQSFIYKNMEYSHSVKYLE